MRSSKTILYLVTTSLACLPMVIAPIETNASSGNNLMSAVVTQKTAEDTVNFTMALPDGGSKRFAKLSFSITELNRRDAPPIQFDLTRVKALAGSSEKSGQPIRVAAFVDETGVLWVEFSQPVPSQSTVTISLKLRNLPARTAYQYGIAAYPAENKSVPLFVGDGILRVE